MNLSLTQKKRIEQAAEVAKKGNLAVAKLIFELHDRLDAELPTLANLMDKIKGKNGENYVLSEKDKKDIAEMARKLVNINNVASLVLSQVVVPIDKIAKKVKGLIPVPQDGKTPTEEELVALIKRIGPPEKGDPGKDADEEAILKKLEIDIPRLGERIRDGLELLEGDERLGREAIRGLDDYEEISRLAKTPKNIIYGPGGIKSIRAGNQISIDDSKPGHPIINARITVSATPPSDPDVNDLWVDIS